MHYRSYGDRKNKSLLFIHGLASSATLCFEPLLAYLRDYYVILWELEGHSEDVPEDFTSFKASVDAIEDFVLQEMNGAVYGLCGFSMGATMAVELVGRGRLNAERLFLDGVVAYPMGMYAAPLTWAFTTGVERIQKGKWIPKWAMAPLTGKGNDSIRSMVYPGVTSRSVKNACRDLYRYEIPEGLRQFSNPVLCLRGSEEPVAKKSEALLRTYLLHMESKVFEGMGHGQLLFEAPRAYGEILRGFLD